MKTIINGKLIVPDSNGDFTICNEALTFDEKITSTDIEIIDALLTANEAN